LRLTPTRQARLEPLALSASGRERTVYGWAAASEDKRIGFFRKVCPVWWHTESRVRSSRSGPIRSLPIRWLLSCISQRGRVRARPDPAGPGVGRGASGVGREDGGPSSLELKRGARGDRKAPERSQLDRVL